MDIDFKNKGIDSIARNIENVERNSHLPRDKIKSEFTLRTFTIVIFLITVYGVHFSIYVLGYSDILSQLSSTIFIILFVGGWFILPLLFPLCYHIAIRRFRDSVYANKDSYSVFWVIYIVLVVYSLLSINIFIDWFGVYLLIVGVWTILMLNNIMEPPLKIIDKGAERQSFHGYYSLILGLCIVSATINLYLFASFSATHKETMIGGLLTFLCVILLCIVVLIIWKRIIVAINRTPLTAPDMPGRSNLSNLLNTR